MISKLENSNNMKNTKTIKTMLFASLIAVMILPASVIQNVSAELISDEIVEERLWGQDKDKLFRAFAEHKMADNEWNKQMLKENIKNYNIETKIGQDIDGYELVALDAQEQILKNKYAPTIAEEKLHEYLFTIYDLPSTEEAIHDRIIGIVGQNHFAHAKQLADSLNRMANMGIIGDDVHKMDSEFWRNIAVLSFCDLTDKCPAGMVSQVNSELYGIDTASIRQVVNYATHTATINIQYQSCETSEDTCYEFSSNFGSTYISDEVPGPSHVGDYYLKSDMTNYSSAGGVVFAMGQVTDSLTGGSQYIQDDDGYVSGTKYLYNPNAATWSQPIVTFTSYALQ